MHVRTKAALFGAVCLSVLASVTPVAHAEGGEGWFVPKASQPAVPPQHAATHRAAPASSVAGSSFR